MKKKIALVLLVVFMLSLGAGILLTPEPAYACAACRHKSDCDPNACGDGRLLGCFKHCCLCIYVK